MVRDDSSEGESEGGWETLAAAPAATAAPVPRAAAPAVAAAPLRAAAPLLAAAAAPSEPTHRGCESPSSSPAPRRPRDQKTTSNATKMVDGYELAPAAAAQLDELLAVVQRLKDEAAPNMTVRVSGGWHVQWIARVNKSSAVGDYYAYRRDDPSRRCRSRRELLRALSASDPADVPHSSLFSSARSDRDCDDVGDDGGSASESSDVDSDDVDQRNIMKGRRRRAEVNYSERPNSDSSDSS